MEFSWALQHQANDQNARNHPENHHEDVNIINQVSARRLLSVTGNKVSVYNLCKRESASFILQMS